MATTPKLVWTGTAGRYTATIGNHDFAVRRTYEGSLHSRGEVMWVLTHNGQYVNNCDSLRHAKAVAQEALALILWQAAEAAATEASAAAHHATAYNLPTAPALQAAARTAWATADAARAAAKAAR